MGRPFVYGQTCCLVTGETLPDTDDERLRQRLAAKLLEECGFSPEELATRVPIALENLPELSGIALRQTPMPASRLAIF